MFGFYGNFNSVWACSLHEYLQVLQWQPRPLKAFRACGIKTRSALLKVWASNFAKYSHILLIGYNGRILTGLFAFHAIPFLSLTLIFQAFSVFSITCSNITHTNRERMAKNILSLKTSEWETIICTRSYNDSKTGQDRKSAILLLLNILSLWPEHQIW